MFKLDRRRYRVGEPEPAYCREADLDKPDVCGIDVSAKELVVRVERCGRREGTRNFSNTASGHQQLRDYLAAPGRPVRVCLEATGLYGLDVALWLERDARFQVMVANPRAVKNFAQALFQRSKNDRLDAGVLLEYAARMPFQAWQPPSRAALQLTAVTRRLQTLTEQATAEKNRGHALAATAASSTVVVADVKRSLRAIEKAQARLARAAEKSSPTMSHCSAAISCCGRCPAWEKPAPCNCWANWCWSRPTPMCGSGWPMLVWIRGSTVPALR